MNLLGTTSDNIRRINTKKWIEIQDESGDSYNIKVQIRFKTFAKIRHMRLFS